MENKLDQRIKPIEERLRELQRKLERHAGDQKTEHDGLKKDHEGLKSDNSKKEEAFQSNGSKIDRLQGLVLKDIMSIQTKIDQIEDALKAEKALREKIEERLMKIEKKFPGAKEEMPNKDDIKEKDNGKEKDPLKDLNKGKDKDKEMEKDKKDDAAGLVRIQMAKLSVARDAVPAGQALLIVTLPANAKLYLNNLPTRSQGPMRSFVTPVLEPGATFTYTFRMELTQN